MYLRPGAQVGAGRLCTQLGRPLSSPSTRLGHSPFWSSPATCSASSSSAPARPALPPCGQLPGAAGDSVTTSCLQRRLGSGCPWAVRSGGCEHSCAPRRAVSGSVCSAHACVYVSMCVCVWCCGACLSVHTCFQVALYPCARLCEGVSKSPQGCMHSSGPACLGRPARVSGTRVCVLRCGASALRACLLSVLVWWLLACMLACVMDAWPPSALAQPGWTLAALRVLDGLHLRLAPCCPGPVPLLWLCGRFRGWRRWDTGGASTRGVPLCRRCQLRPQLLDMGHTGPVREPVPPPVNLERYAGGPRKEAGGPQCRWASTKCLPEHRVSRGVWGLVSKAWTARPPLGCRD